jgi:hypothetical protein
MNNRAVWTDIIDRFGLGSMVRDPIDQATRSHAFRFDTNSEGGLESPYCEACGGGLLHEVHQNEGRKAAA